MVHKLVPLGLVIRRRHDEHEQPRAHAQRVLHEVDRRLVEVAERGVETHDELARRHLGRAHGEPVATVKVRRVLSWREHVERDRRQRLLRERVAQQAAKRVLAACKVDERVARPEQRVEPFGDLLEHAVRRVMARERGVLGAVEHHAVERRAER